MNSPFIISNEFRNKHIVSWPTMEDIRCTDTKIKLLKILFDDIKVDAAGLVIKYDIDEVDILWVNATGYYSQPVYDDYLLDHYTVVGVAFVELTKAENFKEYLDKKLVWKILND